MTAKVIGIIPARFASTRFPGKPLSLILGKTLIQRTFENARLTTLLDEILIATDDQRIFEHVNAFGGRAIMTSLDCPTGTDRLAEVLHHHPHFLEAEAIVNIQGDEPCINPLAIEQTIQILHQDPHASMSTLAIPIKTEEEAFDPSIVKCVVDQYQNALYFSRSCIPSNKKMQFNPSGPYLRHVGLYVYRPEFLLKYASLPPSRLQLEEDLEQLKVIEHGYRIKVAVADTNPIGVDMPEDILKVEQWICKQNIFL